ncbi:hypothetical protein GGH93_003901 [Coemansia aciculifera]|nr:hypothetical protein GGH93_003901 [Coemansia aciculifera]
MDSRSPFQTLPMLIVYKVVEYLEGYPRKLHGSPTDNYRKKGDTLAPLLLVSERWCTAALTSICSVCTLSFSRSREAIEVRFPGWSSSVPHSQFRKTHLAKRVIASANIWQDLCDGKFCEVITLPQYETLSFPSARFFELRLSKAAKKENVVLFGSQALLASTPEIGKEQVASVSRCLLRLVPAVVNVDMTVCSIGDTEPNFEQLYEWLATELCQGRVNRLQVWTWRNNGVLSLNLSEISGLTSIIQGTNTTSGAFTRLAYLNASTLKTLGVSLAEFDWLDLIYGGTNVPVVYADLASLTLKLDETPHTSTWAATDDVEPFPALEKLDISGRYPFGDDLLFRGNGKTLRNLRLPFSAIVENVLGRFNVLKRSGVTRMNSVHIGNVFEVDQESVDANTGLSIERQVHRILEVTLSLVMRDDTTDCHLLHSLLSAPNTAILQHLEFGYLVFNVDDIFEVVAALPSLSSFKCRISGCGPDVEMIPASERPNTLYTKFHPLSHSFRTLIALYNEGDSAKDLAHVVMLLAVVCPSLRTVEVPPVLREDFGREIAWCMINATYKPYADRLKAFIYLE